MERRISGTTGLLCLIGSPVGHSGSPAMYNYSFEKLGLDYAYLAFDIKIEQVEDFIKSMKLLKMRGCNVTMPCKTEAAKYVDEAEAAQWRTLARQMLASLAANYAVKPGTLGSGQLLHGTYSKKSPYNTCTPEGVDECTSWGDYFYMEALTRLTKDWEMYW